MPKRLRPKEFPLAVLFALVCLSASYAQVPSPKPTQTPATSPTPAAPIQQISPVTQATPIPNLLSLDEALRLANTQASSFQSAAINERIAAEDVRQAQAAFLPKVSAPLSYIYTWPTAGDV